MKHTNVKLTVQQLDRTLDYIGPTQLTNRAYNKEHK